MTAACNECSRAKYRVGLWLNLRQAESFSLWAATAAPWPSLSSATGALLCPTLHLFCGVSRDVSPPQRDRAHHTTKTHPWLCGLGAAGTAHPQGWPDLPTNGSFFGIFALVTSMKYIVMEGSEQCWWTVLMSTLYHPFAYLACCISWWCASILPLWKWFH